MGKNILPIIIISVLIILGLAIAYANIPTEWKQTVMSGLGFYDKVVSGDNDLSKDLLSNDLGYDNPWEFKPSNSEYIENEIETIYSNTIGERLIYVDDFRHTNNECLIILDTCIDYPDLKGCNYCDDMIHAYKFFRVSEQYRYVGVEQ